MNLTPQQWQDFTDNLKKAMDAISKSLEKIQHIEPKKEQVLFVTNDGKDVFDGDIYFHVNQKHWRVEESAPAHIINYETYHKGRTNFSTRELAEEYVLLNKPCLSVSDITSNFVIKCDPKYGRRVNGSATLNKLIQLAKTKP